MNHFARAVVAEKRAANYTLVYYAIDANMHVTPISASYNYYTNLGSS